MEAEPGWWRGPVEEAEQAWIEVEVVEIVVEVDEHSKAAEEVASGLEGDPASEVE